MTLTPLKNIARSAAMAVARSLGITAQAFIRGDDVSGSLSPSAKLYQPLRQSAWVRAAVSKVAGPISAVDLYFTQDGDPVDSTDLNAFWSAPAVGADGSRIDISDVQEILASWCALAGECFLILDDTWLLPFPEVKPFGGYTPFILARPDRMRHVIQGSQLVRWEYTDAGGVQHRLLPDQVIHRKMFNPYDDWRGLGPMEAAALAAGADYASGVFAKNVAENNGDQGVIIVAKTGIPTDEQREQIIQQLREKRALQQRGIFRPVFLTGDISVEDPRVRSVDAAFVAQRTEARKEIAIAFGVPASFFDPVASYSIGSASDRFILIEETCKPLGKKMCGAFTAVAQRQTKLPVIAELDWDDHSVMQQVRRERIDAAIKLWGVGVPMSKVSDYLSLDLDPYAGWDQSYLPFSVSPAGSTEATPDLTPEDYSEEPAPAPGDAVADMLAALRSSPDARRQAQVRTANAKLWQSHMQTRRSSVRLYQGKISKVLTEFRATALRKLAAIGSVKDITQRGLVDIIFDKAAFNQVLKLRVNPVTKGVLQKAATELLKEVGKDDPWTMPPIDVLNFIADRENKMAGVGETAFNQLKGELDAGTTAGESMDQLTDRVRTVFNNLSGYEAKRIAMTETAAAYGYSRDKAMVSAGIEYKAWLSSHGPTVRPTHAKAEFDYSLSSPIPVTEPFMVGGEPLMFPGDPNGSPGNVINCQCIQLAAQPPTEDQS